MIDRRCHRYCHKSIVKWCEGQTCFLTSLRVVLQMQFRRLENLSMCHMMIRVMRDKSPPWACLSVGGSHFPCQNPKLVFVDLWSHLRLFPVKSAPARADYVESYPLGNPRVGFKLFPQGKGWQGFFQLRCRCRLSARHRFSRWCESVCK